MASGAAVFGTSFSEALPRARKEGSYAALAALANAKDADDAQEGLKPYKIAVLRNMTVEPVLPVLEAELLMAGLYPDVHVADFDTIASDAMNPDSDLYALAPDCVVIAQWPETLTPALWSRFPTLSREMVDEEIQRVADDLKMVMSALREKTGVPVLATNIPCPGHGAMGMMEAQSGEHQRAAIDRLNRALIKAAGPFGDVYWIDLAGLINRLGYEQAFDRRYWQIARAPLGKSALVPLGRHMAALIRALTGGVRKCLVLDCDNTLWGGIVGEDGMAGVKVGADYPGSAYRAFQQAVLNLKARGVMLAINSKNNEADVLEVFRDHPGMLLREDDFVAMRVNWRDKASNLRELAEELNIGLDALVFADDSAFECDFVRAALPEVAVLHLQGGASGYADKLAEGAYFDRLSLSAEDAKRSEMYLADRKRKNMAAGAASIEDYLRGLEIEAEIAEPAPADIPRVAQLTQKTNQFNLTTRRYTEGDVSRFIKDPAKKVYAMKLRDKIADIGLVGVAIASEESGACVIDTFLMSCRALGRGAEDAMLSRVLRDAGGAPVIGRFLPTGKNAQVARFFPKRGFEETARTKEAVEWRLQPGDKLVEAPDWINVRSPG